MLTWVYTWVVDRLAWPKISWIPRRSAPESSMCVAKQWRSTWGKPVRAARTGLQCDPESAGWTGGSDVRSPCSQNGHQVFGQTIPIMRHRFQGSFSHRHNPLFAAFAGHSNHLAAKVNVIHVQSMDFGNTHARGIEGFKHGLIALSQPGIGLNGVQKTEHILHGQDPGNGRPVWERESRPRDWPESVFPHQKFKKSFQCRQAAGKGSFLFPGPDLERQVLFHGQLVHPGRVCLKTRLHIRRRI